MTPVNDTPTANAQSVSTNEDTALPITLSGTDVETASGNLVYTITTAPAHGTVSAGTGPSRTYTPAANYNGPDSFQFRSRTVATRTTAERRVPRAAAIQSAAATVSITVIAVNDPPVAQNKPTSGIDIQANMKRQNINAGLLTGVTDADDGVNVRSVEASRWRASRTGRAERSRT